MNEKPDIVATVTLWSSDSGGRKGPTPSDKFHCIISIDNKNFDARIYLTEVGSIKPGQTVKTPVRFLSPNLAHEYCKPGVKFLLREPMPIGEGIIEEVIFPSA